MDDNIKHIFITIGKLMTILVLTVMLLNYNLMDNRSVYFYGQNRISWAMYLDVYVLLHNGTNVFY